MQTFQKQKLVQNAFFLAVSSFNLDEKPSEPASNRTRVPPENTTTEDIIKENGRVGSLFASKAFVQLMTNPFVGYITAKRGYHLPFICGTAVLLLSCISELKTLHEDSFFKPGADRKPSGIGGSTGSR